VKKLLHEIVPTKRFIKGIVSPFLGLLVLGHLLNPSPGYAQWSVSGSRGDWREWALRHDGSCFTQHIREALQLNRVRREHYGSLTEGRSRKLSNYLIFLDRLALLAAPWLDRRAERVPRANGMSILCELIPSMETADKVPTRGSPVAATSHAHISPSVAPLQTALRKVRREQSWDQLRVEVEKFQAKLHVVEVDCFTRHYLKTLLRLREVVLDHGTQEASDFGWEMVQWTIPMLGLTARADRWARGFQIEGLPILCSDLPKVPTP
jgi:hypothetical protein